MNTTEHPSSERVDRVNDRIRLLQRTDGLTFGTDAYLLAAYVRPMPRAHAVDLGSGTGILPLLLLTRGKIERATAVELQADYAELIARNAKENRMEERITPLCRDLRTLSARDIGGEVPLVISNPPYFRTDTGRANLHAEKNAARHETAGDIRDFCAAAARLLRFGGRFVCVYRPERMAELFRALAAAALEPKRMTTVHADSTTAPSLLLLEAVKGAAPGLLVSPPLLLHPDGTADQNPRPRTVEAEHIYETCRFPE